MQNEYGMTLRPDEVLVNLASRLKLLANKYKCYISSSTQLNRGAKDENNRDASGLRGSSAIADKCTIGIMCFKVTEREKEKLKHILEKGFYEHPDFMHVIYKNRSGRSGLIIFTKMNYSTMQEKMCFLTTSDYELVTDIQPLKLEFEQSSQVEDVDNPFN